MSKSSRHYCFTLNNYNELEINEIKENIFGWSYCIFGKEIAPTTGTPHLQGYMQFKNCKRFETLKKINPRISWRICKGSDEDNVNYCSKMNKFFEGGERKQMEQGKRTDLNTFKDSILNGTKVETIAIEFPSVYHQYGRTLNKIEDIALRKKYRNWMTTCDWLWGKTGVGKSHKAFDNYNPETHYLWKLNDKNWQDGYTGQEIVIINDFGN